MLYILQTTTFEKFVYIVCLYFILSFPSYLSGGGANVTTMLINKEYSRLFFSTYTIGGNRKKGILFHLKRKTEVSPRSIAVSVIASQPEVFEVHEKRKQTD